MRWADTYPKWFTAQCLIHLINSYACLGIEPRDLAPCQSVKKILETGYIRMRSHLTFPHESEEEIVEDCNTTPIKRHCRFTSARVTCCDSKFHYPIISLCLLWPPLGEYCLHPSVLTQSFPLTERVNTRGITEGVLTMTYRAKGLESTRFFGVWWWMIEWNVLLCMKEKSWNIKVRFALNSLSYKNVFCVSSACL